MNKYHATKTQQLQNALFQIDCDDTITKQNKIKMIQYILNNKSTLNLMQLYIDDLKQICSII